MHLNVEGVFKREKVFMLNDSVSIDLITFIRAFLIYLVQENGKKCWRRRTLKHISNRQNVLRDTNCS